VNLGAAKHLVSRVCGAVVDLDRVLARRRGRYVLAYHRVLPADYLARHYVQSVMWVSPETFDRHLTWMSAVGRVVDLPEILDFDTPNDRPLFAVTFDDGWRDNHDHALPILRRHGVPATIFLVTGAVDSGALFWVEDLFEKAWAVARDGREAEVRAALAERMPGVALERGLPGVGRALEMYAEALKEVHPGERRGRLADLYARLGLELTPIRGELMDWDQVREMARVGVRFGSHSGGHEILKVLDADAARRDLAASKAALEAQLGAPVDAFCYPNARYGPTHPGLVAEAGYRYGFRIDNLPLTAGYDPYLVPRFLVHEGVGADLTYLTFRLLGVPRY
jgi:peptidoglycan/xylan/chitin deacetylase (PgdA/CDA1 family)